jgi:hypothetical protein
MAAFNCVLFNIARTLVRSAEEREKLNSKRLPEFTQSRLDSTCAGLLSPEPIDEDLERFKLADFLDFLEKKLGSEDALVKEILRGKLPQQRADELIRGTQLMKREERKRLWEGGQQAVAKSDDPMIALAQSVDPYARAVRKLMDSQFEAKVQAHAMIEKARFDLNGPSYYPDATFTLRLSFGLVRGYKDEEGVNWPHETRFAALFKKADQYRDFPVYHLPERWWERKGRLSSTNPPLNFVCTADILGGHSGSPVINTKAELVGIVFDGNFDSLVHDYIYTAEHARAVSVHSRAIIWALRNVYDADALADELTGKKR